MFSVRVDELEEAIQPTLYCLSFFCGFSRYEMKGYETHTIIREISPNRVQCQSFLFIEVENGYLYYDIRFSFNVATEKYKLLSFTNDGVNLYTIGYLKNRK